METPLEFNITRSAINNFRAEIKAPEDIVKYAYEILALPHVAIDSRCSAAWAIGMLGPHSSWVLANSGSLVALVAQLYAALSVECSLRNRTDLLFMIVMIGGWGPFYKLHGSTPNWSAIFNSIRNAIWKDAYACRYNDGKGCCLAFQRSEELANGSWCWTSSGWEVHGPVCP